MLDDPSVAEADLVEHRDLRSTAGRWPAEDAARVEAAPGRADPDLVTLRDEVVDGQLEVAEPLVERADRLLRPLGPALEAALVLDSLSRGSPADDRAMSTRITPLARA